MSRRPERVGSGHFDAQPWPLIGTTGIGCNGNELRVRLGALAPHIDYARRSASHECRLGIRHIGHSKSKALALRLKRLSLRLLRAPHNSATQTSIRANKNPQKR